MKREAGVGPLKKIQKKEETGGRYSQARLFGQKSDRKVLEWDSYLDAAIIVRFPVVVRVDPKTSD